MGRNCGCLRVLVAALRLIQPRPIRRNKPDRNETAGGGRRQRRVAVSATTPALSGRPGSA